MGMTTSNSPKNSASGSKLFLKGFHQEHQKLFTPSNQMEGMSRALPQQHTTQYGEYKKVPMSTKNQGNPSSKMLFSSPGTSQQKL